MQNDIVMIMEDMESFADLLRNVETEVDGL